MGKHYIIYNKLVYLLNNEQYMTLMRRHGVLIVAQENATDEMSGADESNDLEIFYGWIEANIKPLSIESDNFDLSRYDRVCERQCCKQELPF